MLFAELVMREKIQAERTEPKLKSQFRWEEIERLSAKFSEWWTGAREN